MDDILITGSDTNEMASVISFFDTTFKIKDLENAHYFLGVEIL